MADKNELQQSKISEILGSDIFKGLLPFIGLVIILGVMYWLTNGRIMRPRQLRLLLSQVYYPMIVATGVFFVFIEVISYLFSHKLFL